jgi:hypothetical protein
MKLIREPAAILNTISALVALLVGFGAFGLTEDVGQAVIAVVSAVTSAIVAWKVRPLMPTFLTGVLTAGIAFLAAVNLIHITERQTGLAVAFLEILLTGLIVRPQSTPVVDPAPATHSV